MSNELITSIVTVLTAIVGVAIIAVLVSKNANTAGVIKAGGSAFGSSLATALTPITGGSGSAGIGSGLGIGFGGASDISYF
jgi:hypothetical protein